MKKSVKILALLAALLLCSCDTDRLKYSVSNEMETSETSVEIMKLNLSDGDAELSLQAYQSVIENNSVLYDTESNSEMYLSEFTQNRGLSIEQYSVIDLNYDNKPEMVLWLYHGRSPDYGFLILHNNEDKIYAYFLIYRAFYDLKSDGTFHFSGGASDYGFGKIDFSGDAYTINKIAYCETVYDDQEESDFPKNGDVQYYIENRSVSQEEFNMYLTEQSKKQDAEWYEYTVEKDMMLTTTTSTN